MSTRRVTLPDAPDGEYAVHVTRETSVSGGGNLVYDGSAMLGQSVSTGCAFLKRFEYESGGASVSGAAVNDPLYAMQHGLPLMKIEAAWKRGGYGQGVVIASVDNGVDLNHPDLAPNLVPGVDLAEGAEGDCAPGPAAIEGHGTHVAGIAAAAGDNGIGVTGVAPRAKLMPVKVCTGTCDLATIGTGVRWAADHGADVVSLSLGSDQITEIKAGATPPYEAWAAGVKYAAGVGAVDKRGLPTAYSNLPRGSADGFAFRAFGGGDPDTLSTLRCEEGVISTMWPGASLASCGYRAYDVMKGTSMAAPQVAGAVAVLVSLGLTPQAAVRRLAETASGGGAPSELMGYGIPDLDAASAGLSPRPQHGPPAGRPPEKPARPRTARACGRQRRALIATIRRAVRARNLVARRSTRARRVKLRRALRRRDAAQRALRACRT